MKAMITFFPGNRRVVSDKTSLTLVGLKPRQSGSKAPAASQETEDHPNVHCQESVRTEHKLLFSEIRQLRDEREIGKSHERKAEPRKSIFREGDF